MRRIGVLGGTFNPVHIGHLAIAQMAKEAVRLKKVIFVPSNWPPHKNTGNIAPAKDRFQMVRLAIKGNPYFGISDFEIKKEGKSYTIDTLRALRAHGGEPRDFWFLVGADACHQLQAWRELPELLRLCHFVIAVRPGFQPTQVPRVARGAQLLEIPLLDVSSTDIRRRLAQHRSIRYLVPEPVRCYIAEHQLYTQAPVTRRS